MTQRLRLTTYIQSLLLALATILGLSGCVQDCNSHLRTGQEPESYISLSFSMRSSAGSPLRAHTDGAYSINTDQTDKEDYVTELRVILLQGNVIKKNVYFPDLAPGEAHALSAGHNEVTFSLRERGTYDMIVIANEHATQAPQGSKTVSEALQTAQSRADLMTITFQTEPFIRATAPFVCPMTAEYKGVDLNNHTGTKSNPHKLILPTTTKGVELMRVLAKVEVTIKDCVQATKEDNAEPTLSWLGPWGFDRVYELSIAHTPRETLLLPANQYSSLEHHNIYQPMTLPAVPDKKYVVGLDELSDEAIGGVYLFDYKSYFYIPEALVDKPLAETQGTQLMIKWRYYPSPIWDPTTTEERETPFQFASQNSQAGDYLTRTTTFDPDDRSVFRNSCYRLTINPYQGDL